MRSPKTWSGLCSIGPKKPMRTSVRFFGSGMSRPAPGIDIRMDVVQIVGRGEFRIRAQVAGLARIRRYHAILRRTGRMRSAFSRVPARFCRFLSAPGAWRRRACGPDAQAATPQPSLAHRRYSLLASSSPCGTSRWLQSPPATPAGKDAPGCRSTPAADQAPAPCRTRCALR